MKDTIFFGALIFLGIIVFTIYMICESIYYWWTGKERPKFIYPITFNEREQKVLSQLMDVIKVYEKIESRDDGAVIVLPLKQVLLDINHKPYTQNFVPGPGQVRLEKAEWDAFVAKLKSICEI